MDRLWWPAEAWGRLRLGLQRSERAILQSLLSRPGGPLPDAGQLPARRALLRAGAFLGGRVSVTLRHGDCRDVLATLPADSVQCCVTSPPYFGLRDYGVAGQIGLEQSPQEYVAQLVAVFREVRRVLRKDGVAFLNLGDSYASTAPGTRNGSGTGLQSDPGRISFRPDWRKSGWPLKPKDLMLIPARVAIALQEDGWWVRSEIIWSKAAPMPESVRDRPTCAHEKVWLLTKSASYFYDADAVAEPASNNKPWSGRSSGGEKIAFRGDRGSLGRPASARDGIVRDQDPRGRRLHCGTTATRNLRNVWHLNTEPFLGAHFATMPPTLAERCIKAGSRPGDTVLDPFAGAGTTLLVADRLQRHGLGIELNPEYIAIAQDRLRGDAPLFAEVA